MDTAQTDETLKPNTHRRVISLNNACMCVPLSANQNDCCVSVWHTMCMLPVICNTSFGLQCKCNTERDSLSTPTDDATPSRVIFW